VSEKRFPPPRGSTGYRDPAPEPEPVRAPPPPPEHAQHAHLVVSRAEDPDVARNKAAMHDPYIREQEARIAAREIARRRSTWIAIAIGVAFFVLRLLSCGSRASRW
jgi:hypothetical protein